MPEEKIKDIKIMIDGKEFHYVGKEIAEYKNVTVTVLQSDNGSISWGWRMQPDTEIEYYNEENEENDEHNNQSET